MIFCDTGCSGVSVRLHVVNRVFDPSSPWFAEEPESEGMIGSGALGLGTGAGGRRDCFAGRLAMTGDLLGIRRVILRWLGRETGHSRGDVMVTVVKWLANDGYWRERCVRHAPASVRAWLLAAELPGFVEVRVVDERRWTCPACWAERMRS